MKKLEKYILAIYALFCVFYIAQLAYAKEPNCHSCECRELHMIRLLLQNQFHVVCDESHCEGSSSSSSNGSSMP